MSILDWAEVFTSVCRRGQEALKWGPPEPWVHVELFAELKRRETSTGWTPFTCELPYVTFYPVRHPKTTNRDWRVEGAVKWVDLCLRSASGNEWCWFELKARFAGGGERKEKSALEARDAFRKDVVALMGFTARLTAETWVNPDEYTKAYWIERDLKPQAPSLLSGDHHFVASFLHVGGKFHPTVWSENALMEKIRAWFLLRNRGAGRQRALPDMSITKQTLPGVGGSSLLMCEWSSSS